MKSNRKKKQKKGDLKKKILWTPLILIEKYISTKKLFLANRIYGNNLWKTFWNNRRLQNVTDLVKLIYLNSPSLCGLVEMKLTMYRQTFIWCHPFEIWLSLHSDQFPLQLNLNVRDTVWALEQFVDTCTTALVLIKSFEPILLRMSD